MKLLVFKSKYFSICALILLSNLFLASGIDAKIVAKPVGGPIRVSPIPGSPDPVLQNLQAVLNNFFQLPYYPGGFPNYLSQVLLQTNTYSAHQIVFNPIDDQIMRSEIGQNLIFDATSTFDSMIPTNVIASSNNGGVSWFYQPPIEQPIPLGGTLSQLINASLGPGLYFEYGKNGRLYASGQGFNDLAANPPFLVPRTGFVFTYSDDNGKTWAPLNIVLTSDVDWWIGNGPYAATGLGPREFYTTLYPPNNKIIHACTTFTIFIEELWGNVFYLRSNNGGKKFSPPREVYSMINDPVWLAEHFDPDFTSDPNYIQFGGNSIVSAHPFVVDQNVLLLPIFRAYPKVGSTTYSGPYNPFAGDTNFDQAFVRSFNNGKTWEKVAGATDQFLLSLATVDPGYADPYAGLFSGPTQQENSLNLSPLTGRLYSTYNAGNPSSTPDPILAQFYSFVLLSASSDKGASWSHAVKVNQTPTDIPIGAQSAFGQTSIMTLDGYLVVAYYDFRNWTGTPGENLLTTPLPTDAWLAIYKETEDPHGGSTGVGLDFVKEVRVTPYSFNARINSQSFPTDFSYPGSGNAGVNFTGTIEGLDMAVNNKNELYVLFSMTGSGSPSSITTGYKGISIDTNNLTNIFIQRYKFALPTNQ